MKNIFIFAILTLLFMGCTKQIAHKETRLPSPREKASLQLTQEGKQRLDEGNPDNAIRLLEQAVGLNPNNGQSYFYLAQAWLIKGVYSEAREFNRLAHICLKNNREWKTRLERQAKQIERIGQ